MKGDSARRLNALIVAAFVATLAGGLLRWLPGDLQAGAFSWWTYTEWLIDYSSGFVRRGLGGALLGLLSPAADTYAVVVALSWASFGLVAIGYLRLIAKAMDRLGPLDLAALLFLPSLLLFYVYDHDAIGRKETLGYLLVLLHLFIVERHLRLGAAARSGAYLLRLAPLAAVALPFHVLVHEAAFLLFVPAHVLITGTVLALDADLHRGGRVRRMTALYLPAAVAFAAACVLGRADFEDARAICEHWEQSRVLAQGACNASPGNPMWSLAGAITALPWSISEAHALVMDLRVEEVVAWAVVLLCLGTATLHFCGRVARAADPAAPTPDEHSATLAVKYFLAPLLLTLPIYALAFDFGRWFAVTSINYAMISLSMPMNRLERDLAASRGAGRGGLLRNAARAVAWLQRLPTGLGTVATVGTLLILVLLVRMPHCCIGWTGYLAEPLRSVISAAIGSR